MNNEKAIVPAQELTLEKWQVIQSVAPAMFKAGLFGVTSAEQAMAIMLKGYEVGFKLTASFEFIHVIQGKPGISPRGALALVQQHPEFAGLSIEEAANSCTVTLKRKNGMSYTATFSIADAQRAGLIKPGSGWEKYPANMLRWRAIGYAIDVVFPDVIGGMKRTDELGADITSSGDTVTSEHPQAPTSDAPKSYLDDDAHMSRLLEYLFAADKGKPGVPMAVAKTYAEFWKSRPDIFKDRQAIFEAALRLRDRVQKWLVADINEMLAGLGLTRNEAKRLLDIGSFADLLHLASSPAVEQTAEGLVVVDGSFRPIAEIQALLQERISAETADIGTIAENA